jgi:hypothetical protein
VEVKIGIQSVPRELVLETSATAEEIERALETAVADGTVLVLQDEKGGRTLIPAEKIAYVELSDSAQRRVGFGANL